jgi:hypothetical protein
VDDNAAQIAEHLEAAGDLRAAYNLAMDYGVLRADHDALRLSEEAVRTAGSTHDVALRLAEYTLGIALLFRDSAALGEGI